VGVVAVTGWFNITSLHWQIILCDLSSSTAIAALTGWSARLWLISGEQIGVLVCVKLVVLGLHSCLKLYGFLGSVWYEVFEMPAFEF